MASTSAAKVESIPGRDIFGAGPRMSVDARSQRSADSGRPDYRDPLVIEEKFLEVDHEIQHVADTIKRDLTVAGDKFDVQLKRLENMTPANFELLTQKVDGLEQRMQKGFRYADERHEKFEKSITERFNAVDARFNAVDDRFNAVDDRFNAVDDRFKNVDQRFDALEKEVRTGFEDVKRMLDLLAERLPTPLIVEPLERSESPVQFASLTRDDGVDIVEAGPSSRRPRYPSIRTQASQGTLSRNPLRSPTSSTSHTTVDPTALLAEIHELASSEPKNELGLKKVMRKIRRIASGLFKKNEEKTEGETEEEIEEEIEQ